MATTIQTMKPEPIVDKCSTCTNRSIRNEIYKTIGRWKLFDDKRNFVRAQLLSLSCLGRQGDHRFPKQCFCRMPLNTFERSAFTSFCFINFLLAAFCRCNCQSCET